VSTIRPPPLLRGLVDLDVLDDQVCSVQPFGVCVGFGIAKETKEELGGLDGPAGLGDTELLALFVEAERQSSF